MPIRWHLAVFGLVVLVPQLLAVATVGWSYANGERRRLDESAAFLAATVRGALDKDLEAMTASLQALATSTEIDRGDFAALYRQAAQVLAVRGTAIAMRDRTHQQVINTYVPYGTPLPVSRDPDLVAADASVFATASPYVSNLYIGAVSRKPFVLVNVPVIRDGAVRYAINMAMSPADLSARLAAMGFPDGWIVTLLDRRQRAIARNRAGDEFVGVSAPQEYVSAAIGTRGTVDHVTALDGTPVFVAFDTSPLSGWQVAVAVPRSLFDAPLRRLGLSIAGSAALALAISAVAAAAYSRRIARDVADIGAMAAAVGQGESLAPPRSGIAELQRVAGALACADAAIRARDRHTAVLIAELNHRVRNTLAVVLALVTRSLRSGNGEAATPEMLSGRIMALARAHDVLNSSDWRSSSLEHLVDRMSDDEDVPVRYDGAHVQLRPDAVVPLSQALHELAIHARSVRGGGNPDRPAVLRSAIAGDHVRLDWSAGAEARGPMSPFGLQIVRLCVERQLGGTFITDPEAGVDARLDIPISRLAEEAVPGGVAAAESRPAVRVAEVDTAPPAP
jgi:two-component sensor histidine kinase